MYVYIYIYIYVHMHVSIIKLREDAKTISFIFMVKVSVLIISLKSLMPVVMFVPSYSIVGWQLSPLSNSFTTFSGGKWGIINNAEHFETSAKIKKLLIRGWRRKTRVAAKKILICGCHHGVIILLVF